ncbi:MAG: gas vesicle protein [Actinomycetota bacterium]
MNSVRPYQSPPPAAYGSGSQNLADILERVLDKGIVIAGDVQVNLLDIELLTIKLRLLIASVDKAQEIGINWWTSDPYLSQNAQRLQDENDMLKERLHSLESMVQSLASGERSDAMETPERSEAQPEERRSP